MTQREIVVGCVMAVVGIGVGFALTPRDCLADSPLGGAHRHVCTVYVDEKDPAKQTAAHCYFADIDGSMTQCLIFNSNKKNAKLLGVEYVISKYAYDMLSKGEQGLWHSHAYDVEAGLLVVQDLYQLDENNLLNRFHAGYGKICFAWPDPTTAVPLGPPTAKATLTEDGKVGPELLSRRDEELRISTSSIRELRKYRYGKKSAPAATLPKDTTPPPVKKKGS